MQERLFLLPLPLFFLQEKKKGAKSAVEDVFYMSSVGNLYVN